MKLSDLQKAMIDDMLTEYWYSTIKHNAEYNSNLEKEYNKLYDFLNKLKEEK
jgi:hypothetical protein